MKNKIFFLNALCFICLTLNSKAQNLDFFHFFSIPEFQAFDVKQTYDGGYLIAGGIHNTNGGDYILVKTDSLGNEILMFTNNRFNGIDGSNTIYSIEIMHSYIYLVGSIQTLFGSPEIIYIVKLDSLFNKIWEIEDTALGRSSDAVNITSSKDENLVISGSASTNSVNKVYAVKIGTSGHFLWKNYFSIKTSAIGLDILELNANKYILNGTCQTFTSSGIVDTSTSFIFSFDTIGNIFWYREFNDTITNGFSSIIHSNDNYLYCGQYYQPNYANVNNPNSSLFKFDTLGNLIYRKEFLNANSWIVNVHEMSNHNLVIAYDFLYVLFLNSQSDSIASYRNNNSYLLKNSILDRQNKVVMIGNYQQNLGSPFISYIMRISDSTTPDINEVSNSNSILIYPNPSNGVFTADLTNTFGKTRITVFDIIGNVIFTKEQFRIS